MNGFSCVDLQGPQQSKNGRWDVHPEPIGIALPRRCVNFDRIENLLVSDLEEAEYLSVDVNVCVRHICESHLNAIYQINKLLTAIESKTCFCSPDAAGLDCIDIPRKVS